LTSPKTAGMQPLQTIAGMISIINKVRRFHGQTQTNTDKH